MAILDRIFSPMCDVRIAKNRYRRNTNNDSMMAQINQTWTPGSKMSWFGSKLFTPGHPCASRIWHRRILTGFVFWWLQFSTPSICCGDFDGYYHIKWSQLLWNGLRKRSLPSRFHLVAPNNLNSSHYADQHFLYHILLIPFTWFGDLRLGAKLATTLFVRLLFSPFTG